MSQHRTALLPHGFTLIEMILVIVVLGILSTVGMNMISDSYTNSRMVNNGNANTSRARYAMERMVRDIRQTAYDSQAKSVMVSEATSTQLSFTKSGLLANSTLRIVAKANGSDAQSTLFLNLPVGGSDVVLAEHVSAFQLSYFDASMVSLPLVPQSLGLIRFVKIELTIHEANTEAVALQTVIALRNG